jgi:hypothetical protein
MTKAKKPLHDDSQIEEIDLSLIDSTSIDLLRIKDELPSSEDTTKAKKLKDTDIGEFDITKDDHIDDIELELKAEFEDDFDDFDDDFDDLEEDDEDGDGEKKDGYKTPKDFFTDKRRKKSLKKFIDVTIPAEFLE